jgi:chromosome segregation ATPase
MDQFIQQYETLYRTLQDNSTELERQKAVNNKLEEEIEEIAKSIEEKKKDVEESNKDLIQVGNGERCHFHLE